MQATRDIPVIHKEWSRKAYFVGVFNKTLSRPRSALEIFLVVERTHEGVKELYPEIPL